MAWGTNGQWVRARDKEGIKAFMAEYDADQQRVQKHVARRDAAIRAIVAWFRKRFRQ